MLLFAVQDAPVERSTAYRFEMSRAYRVGEFHSSVAAQVGTVKATGPLLKSLPMHRRNGQALR